MSVELATTAIALVLFVLANELIAKRIDSTQVPRLLHDNFTHAGIGGLLCLPLGIEAAVVGFLAASLIDLDHLNFGTATKVIMGRQFATNERLTKTYSPTHSLLFGVAASAAAYLFDPLWAAAVLVGLTSHVLRDAAMHNTPFLWPLKTNRIPYWLFSATLAITLTLTAILSDSNL